MKGVLFILYISFLTFNYTSQPHSGAKGKLPARVTEDLSLLLTEKHTKLSLQISIRTLLLRLTAKLCSLYV